MCASPYLMHLRLQCCLIFVVMLRRVWSEPVGSGRHHALEKHVGGKAAYSRGYFLRDSPLLSYTRTHSTSMNPIAPLLSSVVLSSPASTQATPTIRPVDPCTGRAYHGQVTTCPCPTETNTTSSHLLRLYT